MIIDSRIGGLGDVWMRLLALYTLGRLTNRKHTILIHPTLLLMARSLFGERIEINHEGHGDVIYTHLGLRLYWVTRSHRKCTTLKHRLNDALILGVSKMGLLRLPDPGKITDYEGYMEVSALPPFRHISFEEFSREASQDLRELQLRLKKLGSAFALKNSATVVYPSGNAHQIMPPAWAEQHLKGATFVFHRSDPYAGEFENRDLKVEKFDTLDELLQSGFGARRIICSDSFPSHFWQVYTTNVVLLLTEQLGSYVVHPGFPPSQIIASRAPCNPCRHIARGPDHAPCQMGHATCLTWGNADYQAAFEKILSS